LGSINHTLLSIGALKSRNIPIEGIVFVGEENKATESIILYTTGVHFIARIPLANEVNSTFIQDQSEVIKEYFQS
jgi:dethiobiotin synthetase